MVIGPSGRLGAAQSHVVVEVISATEIAQILHRVMVATLAMVLPWKKLHTVMWMNVQVYFQIIVWQHSWFTLSMIRHITRNMESSQEFFPVNFPNLLLPKIVERIFLRPM